MTEFKWLPRSLEYVQDWRIDQELCEAVVAHPTSTGLHPSSGEHGYEIRSYRRGDMEVCVSYKPGEDPAIAYVHLHLPGDRSKGSPTSGGPVKKAAAKAPNGLNEFKQRVFDAGYIPKLQNGHIHIRRQDGSLLMSTGSTPGDKMAVTNAWQTFLRWSRMDGLRAELGLDRQDSDRKAS